MEVREPVGKTEQVAMKKLKLRRKQVAAHDLGLQSFIGPQSERVTIDTLLKNLERQYEIEGREQKKAHSHLKHVRAFFGFERAVCVTAARLNDYISTRQRDDAANGTINRELRILHRAFTLASEQTVLLRGQVPVFTLLPEQNIREGFVDGNDFGNIMRHIHNADVRDFIGWGFWTGMRSGGIRALTWAAFDKEHGVCDLRPAMTRYARVSCSP